MKLKGIIQENLFGVSFSKNRAFLCTQYVVYELIDDELVKIRAVPLGCKAQILCDGLWLTCDGVSRYSDIFNLGLAYPDVEFKISDDSCCSGNHLIAKSVGGEPFRLSVINLNNLDRKEVAFSRVFTYSFNEHNIFVRTNGYRELTCYDYALNKQWEYTLEGQLYADFERKPQLHKDLIIALNKETGQEVWKHTFEDTPTSNILMQGEIYAVCRAVLYIINPDTGKVEVERDTGFPEYKFNNPRERNHIGLFPVGNYLYGVAKYDENHEWLRLYNRDASEVLDKKRIPDYWINPYGSVQPVIHNGVIYQRVRNAYSFSTSGILVIELTEDEGAAVKIQPRPPVIMLATPSLNESHKLQIYLDVDSLDDALRYGELLSQELFYTTGYVTIYELRENALDRKHNGVVELIIDDTGFDACSDEYLDDLAEELNGSLDNSMLIAGDKKTRMQFKLIKQKKSEWNLSGERLDWPAIRDQETPLV